MLIPIVAIVLFAIGAAIGVYMLTSFILKNKPTPGVPVGLHGIFNTLGLIMVITTVVRFPHRPLIVADLILFLIAAAGGFTLFYFDAIKRQIPPKNIAVLHPIIAAISVILLIAYCVTYAGQ